MIEGSLDENALIPEPSDENSRQLRRSKLAWRLVKIHSSLRMSREPALNYNARKSKMGPALGESTDGDCYKRMESLLCQ